MSRPNGTNGIHRKIVIDMRGITEQDLEDSFDEVVRLIKLGFTSGRDENDLGFYSFNTKDINYGRGLTIEETKRVMKFLEE